MGKTNTGAVTTTDRKTKRDIEALREAVRLSARVAKADVERRAAFLRAEIEAQLCARYSADDERWATVVETAERIARDADAELLRIAKRDGIPLENRPRFQANFRGRDAWEIRQRREEVRKKAAADIDLAARNAKLEIERKQAALQVELLADGLETIDAREFLSRMPTPEQLLPGKTMQEIDVLVSSGGVLRLVSGNTSTGTDDD